MGATQRLSEVTGKHEARSRSHRVHPLKSLCLFAGTYSQADDLGPDPQDDPHEHERVGGATMASTVWRPSCDQPLATPAGLTARLAKTPIRTTPMRPAAMWTPTTSSAPSQWNSFFSWTPPQQMIPAARR